MAIKSKRFPVSPAKPCEVCGGKSGCSVGDDQSLMCYRPPDCCPDGLVKVHDNNDGSKTYRLKNDGWKPLEKQRHQENRQQAANWHSKIIAWQREFTQERRTELASHLGLPEHVFDYLPIGWHPGEGCWVFPEYDGHGSFVGASRRWPNGQKKRMAGARAGLTIPSVWSELSDCLYLVEGASDVLACLAMGLSVVGRPNNHGGVEYLGALLRDFPKERRIIVLGEFDPSPKGIWPGLEGARSTAEKLASILKREIEWALPPSKAKDIRGWLCTN